MAYQRALDYVDVAARLREMRDKYPELSMQKVEMEFVSMAGKDWVVYTAAAYRTPDDVRPGIGTAWEPIPGPTPYTKDSEVQNAETSAWGRALVAIGADTKAGIASAEEVTNRTGGSPQREPVQPGPTARAVKTKLGHAFSSASERKGFVEEVLGRELGEGVGIDNLGQLDLEAIELRLDVIAEGKRDDAALAASQALRNTQ